METKTWFTTYCMRGTISKLSVMFFFNLCFLHSWQTAIFLRPARWPPTPVNFRIKARLHFQFLLRFSSSDGCERVNKLWILWVYVPSSFIIWTFLTHSLVHIHQEKKIAAKIASVNAPPPHHFSNWPVYSGTHSETRSCWFGMQMERKIEHVRTKLERFLERVSSAYFVRLFLRSTVKV